STAFFESKKFPPSENESGVTFNTPMISPCRERSKRRSPIFQSLPRIMDETNTGPGLFETVAVDLRVTRHRRALHVSVARRPARRLRLFFSRVASHQLALRDNVPFYCCVQLAPFRTSGQVQLAVQRENLEIVTMCSWGRTRSTVTGSAEVVCSVDAFRRA